MDLIYGLPKELGFDPDRLAEAKQIVQRGLDDGLYPGAVYLIGRKDKILQPECFGVLAAGNARCTRPDTVYDIASLTKPIATATSILILLDRNKIHLDQPISDFFASENQPHLSQITVMHLLTHTSGLHAWKDLHSESRNRNQVIERLLSTVPENAPGTTYTYSCLGYMLLGEIVKTVSGQTLDEFSWENIFSALGMSDTTFNPGVELIDRIAATANCPVRKRALIGEVQDANAWAMGGVSGNAGLFSTAMDLARFARMLLTGGEGVLSSEVLRLCFENLIDPNIGGHSAGWFINPNEMLPCGDILSTQAIGHTGFTGTSIVIDVACDLFVILLTNRVCMPDDGADFRNTRRLFNTIVAQAMLRC
jgi:CubicO group peptidase (beta-lactamase class C family)